MRKHKTPKGCYKNMNNQKIQVLEKNRRAKIKYSIGVLEDKLKKFQKVEQKGKDGK